MNHINKLIELILKLEELNWQYAITHEDMIEVVLGNRLVEISKYDAKAIHELIEEIEFW